MSPTLDFLWSNFVKLTCDSNLHFPSSIMFQTIEILSQTFGLDCILEISIKRIFIAFSKYYAHASFFILSVGFIIFPHPQAKIKIIWPEPNPRKFEAVVDWVRSEKASTWWGLTEQTNGTASIRSIVVAYLLHSVGLKALIF